MDSSVNVLKDSLVNAVKKVRNYTLISCIKYNKLSYCRISKTAPGFLSMTRISGNSGKFCLIHSYICRIYEFTLTGNVRLRLGEVYVSRSAKG